MERQDLRYLKAYTQRISAHDGDLSVLRPIELVHLKTLIRKREIEVKLLSMDDKMSQVSFEF